MQPTSFDLTPSASLAPAPDVGVAPSAVISTPGGLSLPPNFPVRLTSDQVATIQQRVADFNFAQIKQAEIPHIGAEPTLALNRFLDTYLQRINRAESPQIFALIPALSESVAKERLGDLADRILNAQPGLRDRLLSIFS